jgi:large subunit ribosomal protein L19
MANFAKSDKTEFGVGDKIKLFLKIQEGDKIRSQPFEGLVIAIKGREENKMFTVRRMASGGIGVERIFPLNSPWIAKIEVMKKSRTRKAKLYYLRQRTGKKAIKVQPQK